MATSPYFSAGAVSHGVLVPRSHARATSAGDGGALGGTCGWAPSAASRKLCATLAGNSCFCWAFTC